MFKKIIAAAALATIAASSFAATPGTIYAGVDVGSSKVDDISGHDTSYGAFVGYNFAQNFAVEGGYRRLGSLDVTGGDIRFNQAAVSVIGTLPIANGFSVFSRLGFNRVESKSNYASLEGGENGALYGVGVGYDFGNKLSARIEIQKPTSYSTNVSAGLAYSF
jgi:hypothetical protein